MTEDQFLQAMKKKWYIWEMAKAKKRIKSETKDRMKAEFELSVIAYAHAIKARWSRLDDPVQ